MKLNPNQITQIGGDAKKKAQQHEEELRDQALARKAAREKRQRETSYNGSVFDKMKMDKESDARISNLDNDKAESPVSVREQDEIEKEWERQQEQQRQEREREQELAGYDPSQFEQTEPDQEVGVDIPSPQSEQKQPEQSGVDIPSHQSEQKQPEQSAPEAEDEAEAGI